jgi:hypothetical protein
LRPYDPAARTAALRALIRLERPLGEAIDEVRSFPYDWDGEPLETLTHADLATILRRWRSGELGADNVEGWANALECRDDVQFEGEQVLRAIDVMANPALHGASALDEIAASFLA